MTITKKVIRAAKWKVFSVIVRLATSVIMLMSLEDSVAKYAYIQLWGCFLLALTAAVSFYVSYKTTFVTKALLFISVFLEISVDFITLVINLAQIKNMAESETIYSVRFESAFSINTFWTLIDFVVCFLLLWYYLQLKIEEQLISPSTRSRHTSRRGTPPRRSDPQNSHHHDDVQDTVVSYSLPDDSEFPFDSQSTVQINYQINTETSEVTPPPNYSEAKKLLRRQFDSFSATA